MTGDVATVADHDIGLNDGEGPHADFLAKPSMWANASGGMNSHLELSLLAVGALLAGASAGWSRIEA